MVICRSSVSSFVLIASVGFVLATAGCGSSADIESSDAESTDDALSGSKVLDAGTIRIGESKLVHYAPQPLYRAFAFSGHKGDVARFHAVASTGGVVRLYGLNASNRTLTYSTKGKDLSFALPADGVFKIALASASTADVTLTMSGTFAAAPSTVDDPPVAACVGDFTSSERDAARAGFPITAHTFTRACTETGSKQCGAWTEQTPALAGLESAFEKEHFLEHGGTEQHLRMGVQGNSVSLMQTHAETKEYFPISTTGSVSTVTLKIYFAEERANQTCTPAPDYCVNEPWGLTNYWLIAEPTGAITESCVRLSTPVTRSTGASGGPSYTETVNYWTND